ncbi:MAG: hypothetical protein VYC34_03240 [Planctomycetota bacterium]|nr:hypothetical protein [Planctomycetota bacterium]
MIRSICTNRRLALVSGLAIAASAAPAFAGSVETFGFTAITNNGVQSVIIAETQLFVDVSSPGAGLVNFLFRNVGPEASSVANIYWDDNNGRLSAITGDLVDTGVSFSAGGAPPDLPSGSNVGFVDDFRIAADPPPSSMGINAGEQLDVRFTLSGMTTLAQVIADLQSGALRIGMHVIAFDNGQSESLVTSVVIPSPSAAGLASLGLVGCLGLRRRR